MLNPFESLRLNSKMPEVMMKIGIEIISRLKMDFCLKSKKSAIINLAERKAVSPDVMGAAMTPKMAKIPPIVPSLAFVISLTMIEALFSPMPFSWKKQVAAAAQINATMPSVIMAP